MNGSIIRKDALDILMRVVLSCNPITQDKKRENERVLVDYAKRDEDVGFDAFTGKLTQGSKMYEDIFEFSRKSGNSKDITAENILSYFGEDVHINKTIRELEELGIDTHVAMLFIHTLLPVRVESIQDDGVNVVYENGKYRILIKNIMFLNKDMNYLEVGKEIYVHYPLVIDVENRGDLFGRLLEMQLKHSALRRVIEGLSGNEIDYKKFPHLLQFISDSIKRYHL